MKKLTVMNVAQQEFWKMPHTFIDAIYETFPDWKIQVITSLESEIEHIKDAHAIISSPFSASLVRGNKNLEWVHLLSAQVPLSWQKLQNQYMVTNSSATRDAVAEHALYLALKGLRGEKSYQDKSWNQEHFRISKVASECRLGIVGFGNIGERISTITNPIFQEIRFLTNRSFSPDGTIHYNYEQMKDFFEGLDVMILATNHSVRSAEIFHQKDFFEYLPPDIIMVNIARGEIFEEKDLFDFFHRHPNAFYLTDVTYPEPYPKDGLLYQLPNGYISPHIGGKFNTLWSKLEKELRVLLKDRK